MANIKSAKKRIEVIDRQTMENKTCRSKIATYVKKYKVAVDNGDKEASAKLLSETFSQNCLNPENRFFRQFLQAFPRPLTAGIWLLPYGRCYSIYEVYTLYVS